MSEERNVIPFRDAQPWFRVFQIMESDNDSVTLTLVLGNKAKPKCIPIRQSLNFWVLNSLTNKTKPAYSAFQLACQ